MPRLRNGQSGKSLASLLTLAPFLTWWLGNREQTNAGLVKQCSSGLSKQMLALSTIHYFQDRTEYGSYDPIFPG